MGLTLVGQAVVGVAELPRDSRSGGLELLGIGRLGGHRYGDRVRRIHQRCALSALPAKHRTGLAYMINDGVDVPRVGVPGRKVGDVEALGIQGGNTFGDGLLIPLPTGKTLVGCQNDGEDILQMLRSHAPQHIPYIGRPVAHANVDGQVDTLRFEEVRSALRLLQRQVIEGGKTSQLGVVCGDLSYARLGCEVLTHNALDKTRRLITGTGCTPLTAPGCGTTKSDK